MHTATHCHKVAEKAWEMNQERSQLLFSPFCFVEEDVLYAVFLSEQQIKKKTHNHNLLHTLPSSSHRVVVLSSAEDDTAGGDLLLRGAGRWEVLAAAQRSCQAVRRDLGHGVGDGNAGLLQLTAKERVKSKYASQNTHRLDYIIYIA